MLARVGASRATEATSRGKKAFKESFPARVLFVSTPVTRRERRGRRVVTRARRARRARLRASRPVAARAASRTRFGASSRSVLHAFCFFTRFVFSRVLFFHRVWVVTLSFVRQNFKKKKKKKQGLWEFRSCNGQTLSQVRRLKGGD